MLNARPVQAMANLARRMSTTDAGFLYLERPNVSLSIGLVAVLESAISFGDLMDHYVARRGKPGAVVGRERGLVRECSITGSSKRRRPDSSGSRSSSNSNDGRIAPVGALIDAGDPNLGRPSAHDTPSFRGSSRPMLPFP